MKSYQSCSTSDDKHSIHHGSINFLRQQICEKRFFLSPFLARLCFSPQTDFDFIVSFAENSAETFLVLLASFQIEAGKNNGKSLAHGKHLGGSRNHGIKWKIFLWHRLRLNGVLWGEDWLHRRRSNCCWSQITEKYKNCDNQHEFFCGRFASPKRID